MKTKALLCFVLLTGCALLAFGQWTKPSLGMGPSSKVWKTDANGSPDWRDEATITNMLFGSATLDFPSTGASAKADLSIPVTGAAAGDECFVGVPAGSAQITGNFTWYSSNGMVWVRFTSLATGQNPASGTFKATVWKR